MVSTTRRSGLWLACLVAGAGVGAMAFQGIHAEAPPKAVIKSPHDLSSAFRAVSETSLPAIVAIETIIKPKVLETNSRGGDDENGQADPFQNSPFKDDPIFREFFGRRGGPRQSPGQHGAGSGFVIDSSGIIVTNSHVVNGADEVRVKFADGTEIKAESWVGDSVTDVAIIKLKADKPLATVDFGDSDAMQVGDWVLALGNPFDIGTTVTAGIISATDRKGLDINGREHFLQTDAAINPGNSGGALVNMNGEVVGINTAISSRSGGYDGIGFAIPSNQARKIVDKLRADGTVHRSYIGVTLDDLKPQLKKALGVASGVAVMDVLPNAPASKAGIQPGDVIVKFAGEPVKNRPSMQEFVEQLEPGKSYTAEVLRDGKMINVEITLEQRTSDAYTKGDLKKDAPEKQKELSKLGFKATTLTPELSKQLGAGDLTGVVILSVDPGSVSGQAGLREGDVVTKVANTKVETLEAFQKAVEEAKLEDGLLLQVRRGTSTRLVLLQNE